MKKKSNHYIPRFILRYFSNNGKSIGIYIIRQKRYIPEASIKKHACKDYLYGVDNKLEDIFMQVETNASRIINTIIKTKTMPDIRTADYASLMQFFLLSEARNLKTADSYHNMLNVQYKSIAKMQKRLNIPDDLINRMKVKSSIPNLTAVKATVDLYPILFDLKCVLIISTCDRRFLLSDIPLIRYNQMNVHKKNYIHGYGLVNWGIQLFFPLTPKMCVCLFDDIIYDYKPSDGYGNILINKGKEIDQLNKLIFLSAYKYIYFDNHIKEKYINSMCRTIKLQEKDLQKEITELGSEDNKLIIHSPLKVTEKIKLPFTIRKKFIKLKLPTHMAGLIRPNARKFI